MKNNPVFGHGRGLNVVSLFFDQSFDLCLIQRDTSSNLANWMMEAESQFASRV